MTASDLILTKFNDLFMGFIEWSQLLLTDSQIANVDEAVIDYYKGIMFISTSIRSTGLNPIWIRVKISAGVINSV